MFLGGFSSEQCKSCISALFIVLCSKCVSTAFLYESRESLAQQQQHQVRFSWSGNDCRWMMNETFIGWAELTQVTVQGM